MLLLSGRDVPLPKQHREADGERHIRRARGRPSSAAVLSAISGRFQNGEWPYPVYW
jgi:hypothetical protein